MRLTRITIAAVLTGMFLGSCRAPSKEPKAASLADEGTSQATRTREPAVADCIKAIHTRLLSLRDQYPQLSDIEQARVTPTSLRYAKGSAVVPKKQVWSRPDGCLILVSFMKYSPTNHNQTGAIRQFPEYGIQVYWLIQPIRLDSGGFYTTVASVIKEEIEKLKGALSLPDAAEGPQPADQTRGR